MGRTARSVAEGVVAAKSFAGGAGLRERARREGEGRLTGKLKISALSSLELTAKDVFATVAAVGQAAASAAWGCRRRVASMSRMCVDVGKNILETLS